MPSTTLDEFRLHMPIALMQRVGMWSDKTRLRLVDLNPDSLIAAAQRQTGFSDWGGDDFLRDYRVLMEMIAADGDLMLLGKLSLHADLLRTLTTRLRMIALLAERPTPPTQRIERPLFIVGLPRTGTTLLHKLFAADPSRRVAAYWELLAPYPPDVPPATAQRIRRAETLERMARYMFPAFAAIHPIEAHSPEECVFLLPHNFTFHTRAFLPAYADWLLTRDFRPDYTYHKQQLHALSIGHEGKRWVLKSPFHLFSLPELFATYPDAAIIHTHRDPVPVIGSWCSFACLLAMMHRRPFDLRALAADWVARWQAALQRAVEMRTQLPPAAAYDLHFHDLTADPIAAMRRLYAHFGDDLSPEAERRMRALLTQEKQARMHASHRYDLAQFGLSAAQIDAAFRAYVEQFHVRLEGRSS
jgi:hypothetical protein